MENDRVYGHFSSLWVPDGSTVVATTVTNRKKSLAKQRERAKKEKLLAELKSLTGGEVSAYSKSIDGVKRRWNNVSGHGAD